MIQMVLDFKDEQLCDHLNHVLSGLLPHESYQPSTFSLLYPALSTILPSTEARGLYFAFYTVLEKFFKLQSSMEAGAYQVNIARDRFATALTNNLPDLILEPHMQVSEIMSEEGKSGDITIPTVQNDAMQVVFEKTMNLYDTCYELGQTYEDAMAYIINLKDSMKANIIDTGIKMQRAIISTGYKYGRKNYRGTTGWVEFSQQLVREVSELDAITSDDLTCDNLEMLSSIERQTVAMSEGIAEYGIPQLDDRTPILPHRFVVLVARENVGKTQVVTHLIASVIRAGGRPYFACGESQPNVMFLRVVSSYIYQEYGLHFTEADLVGEGLNALSSEDFQIVQTAKARCASSGMVISNSLEYDNVTATFTRAFYNGCNAFFIDHSQSLRGRKGRKIGDLVTNLALDCREFKNNYPVYIFLTSHPSTNLKDILQKGIDKDFQQSPTAQSATPAQEADELFILNDTDYLRKQNLLQWIVYKRRGATKPAPFFIKKLFHVAAYLYDPNLQGGENVEAEEMDSIIRSIGTSSDKFDPDADELQVDWDD